MKQKITLPLVGILIFCLMSPALSSSANWPPIVGELVAEAKKSVKTIDMAAFKVAVDEKEDALIVDVRVPDEYATGHIAGAINIPRGLIEFMIWGKVGFPDKTDMSKKIYLYCKGGHRCTLAAKSLQDLGFTNVFAVDMKLSDWINAGYPLSSAR